MSPAWDFPKYNMFKDKDGTYVLEFAVAGYSKSNLRVKQEPGVLEIEGVPPKLEDSNPLSTVYKGITTRPFKVSIALPQGSEVGKVKLDNGILSMEVKSDYSVETKLLPIQ